MNLPAHPWVARDQNRHCCGALFVACLALVAPTLYADGFIHVPDHTIRTPFSTSLPRPEIGRRRQFPLVVNRHQVSIAIDGNVARTRVDETFHNPNPYQLEGTYLFPLPPGASIANFSMSMNGKMVDGEVLEKDKARTIYESIVRQMKDPGLLEYVDRQLFRARVFPIPARGDIQVAIAYDEHLKLDHGHSRYRYPLDTGKYSSGSYKNVLIDLKIRSTVAIRGLRCPSHEADITRVSDKEAHVTFEAKTLEADKDFVVDWNVSEDALAPTVLTYKGSEAQPFFLFSVSPKVDRAASTSPKDLVFLLDSSGSMVGPKMEDARRAVQYCVRSLSPGDRFNVVDFSSEARRFRDELVLAVDEEKTAAVKYIEALKARGGTRVEDGLRTALGFLTAEKSDRLRMIVFISDGEPTLGMTKPSELLNLVKDLQRTTTNAARIFCFGVGVEVDTILLEQLASKYHGAVDFVLPGEQLEITLSNFYDKIDQPVLTGVEIDFGDLEVSEVYPKPLPDLFRGDDLLLFGRFKNPGRHTVVVRGNYAGKQAAFEYSLDFPADVGPRNDFLPRTWAARKVGFLLETIRLSGEKKELVDEVVTVSKRYGVLTPYTSYLIIEDERRHPPRTVGAIPRPLTEVFRRVRESEDAASPNLAPDSAPDSAPGFSFEDRVVAAPGRFSKRSGGSSIRVSRNLKAIKEGRLHDVRRFVDREMNRGEARVLHVAGTTFYRIRGQWIDIRLDRSRRVEAREIKYLSDEYFALVKSQPGIGRILSLGKRLAFLWKDQAFVVTE